jgi:hypothetical protein
LYLQDGSSINISISVALDKKVKKWEEEEEEKREDDNNISEKLLDILVAAGYSFD